MKTVLDIADAPYTDNELELMFFHQKELMEAYRKVDRLPAFPFESLTPRENQDFFREMMSFFDEEIREAYDEAEKLSWLVGDPNFDRKECLSLLMKYNEELADTMHFMLEMLVFANIESEDVMAFYQKIIPEGFGFLLAEGQPLKTAFNYAHQKNFEEGYGTRAGLLSKFSLFDHEPTNYFLQAGRFTSRAAINDHAVLMFKAEATLSKARNLLKNKYWKKSVTPTDVGEFQTRLMEAWMAFIQYLSFAHSNPEHIYQIYYKKNQVNLNRIIQGW